MVLDTNVIIQHIRRQSVFDPRSVIPIVVVGELEAFALKADWGIQKVRDLRNRLNRFPIVDIDRETALKYAEVDAYSQNKLRSQPLSGGATSRNMGKNVIWIAAIALQYDLELHSTDNDFDHLPEFGLKLVKPSFDRRSV
jgi:tRNA(fMet)-specific endonuclease VapC